MNHPKPTALKQLHGNPGKRPLNLHEPVPEETLPEPSEHASQEVRAIFYHFRGKLERLGYASATYADLLELLATRMALLRRLERELRGAPLVIESKAGSTMVTPELKALNDVARHVQSLLNELGLSPVSTPRVTVPARASTVGGFAALRNIK